LVGRIVHGAQFAIDEFRRGLAGMCSTGVPEKRASISPPMAFAAPGPVDEKMTPRPADTRA
jgi:hypothetical protein